MAGVGHPFQVVILLLLDGLYLLLLEVLLDLLQDVLHLKGINVPPLLLTQPRELLVRNVIVFVCVQVAEDEVYVRCSHLDLQLLDTIDEIILGDFPSLPSQIG